MPENENILETLVETLRKYETMSVTDFAGGNSCLNIIFSSPEDARAAGTLISQVVFLSLSGDKQ